MSPPLRLALVGSLVLTLGAGRAEASCKIPEWYGTPAGASVPPEGVLYHFSSAEGEGSARMVRYQAAEAEALGLVVDPGWTAPVEAPRVLAIQRSKLSWTCSAEDALAIQIDQAVAAVRVFWATSEGQHEMIIAPRPYQTPRGRPAAILMLGELNCAGQNLPVDDLGRGVVLGLTAIRNDGSEIAIQGVPTIVALSDFPATSRELAPLGFDVILDESATAKRDDAPWKPRTNGAMPIVLVVGAIVLGARRGIAGAKASDVKLPVARTR